MDNGGWHVRPFRMADYEDVLALWRSVGPGLHIRPSDRRGEIAKKLQRDPDLFLVAEAQDGIAGVIMGAWDGRRGWLHHLAVASGYRRQGIATALVGAVEERLREKGCLKVNLLVFSDNQSARDFYRMLGYSEMLPISAMGKEL